MCTHHQYQQPLPRSSGTVAAAGIAEDEAPRAAGTVNAATATATPSNAKSIRRLAMDYGDPVPEPPSSSTFVVKPLPYGGGGAAANRTSAAVMLEATVGPIRRTRDGHPPERQQDSNTIKEEKKTDPTSLHDKGSSAFAEKGANGVGNRSASNTNPLVATWPSPPSSSSPALPATATTTTIPKSASAEETSTTTTIMTDPPPKPPMSSLRRHQSEPVPAGGCRRSIFAPYWDSCHDGGLDLRCGAGRSSSSIPETAVNDNKISTTSTSSSSASWLTSSSARMSELFPVSPHPNSKKRVVAASAAAPSDDGSGSANSTATLPALPDVASYRDFPPPTGSNGATTAFLRTRQHFIRADDALLPVQIVSTPSPSSNQRRLVSHADIGGGANHPPLPPLPSPLRRFCSAEGNKRTSMRGMYPMVALKPILRQSSYRNLTGEPSSPGTDASDNFRTTKELEDALNLTKSIRKLGTKQVEFSRCSSTSSSTSASSSSAASPSTSHRVAFDPRITVTEFDERFKRKWFSDSDLERFRMETVLLAQKYFARHPEMIKTYQKPVRDPVTGTMRKKALFSLPALSADTHSTSSCSSVEDEEVEQQDSAQSELAQYRQMMKDCTYHEVRKILIVDRNRLILDLFRRSLLTVFPHTKITTVQSGEDALQLFRQTMPPDAGSARTGYDIVIAEERLDLPLVVSRTPDIETGRKTSRRLPGAFGALEAFVDGRAGNRVPRNSSLTSLQNAYATKPIPGTELFRRIRSLEDTVYASQISDQDGDYNAVTMGRLALLIGVSTNPGDASQSLYDSGADLVWGKPPPRMDDHLRDHLVLVLTKKRCCPRDEDDCDGEATSSSSPPSVPSSSA